MNKITKIIIQNVLIYRLSMIIRINKTVKCMKYNVISIILIADIPFLSNFIY